MKRHLFWFGAMLLMVGVACTPSQLSGLQTMAASIPNNDAPLGGQVAAIAMPNSEEAAATPPPSLLPTAAPTLTGPLATLTAVSAMIPTIDLWATPYAITLQGKPHFIEFQAAW